MEPKQAIKNYIKAAGKGVLKVMSKMGISTVASYRGAQVFEATGLGQELVDEYFTGTVSRLGGIGLDEIAEEVARRHAIAYAERPDERAHAGERGDRERREPRDPLRPLCRRRERADSRTVDHRRGAPPPRPREDPHAGRAARRDG
jgi:glutamate synthase domain-containing protein 2